MAFSCTAKHKQLRLLLTLALLVFGVIPASAEKRIVNGEKALSNQFPWQVALMSNLSDPFQSQFCGGTIIHARWVVTAAHCGEDLGNATTYVVAGITDLEDPDPSVVSSATWFSHPAYDNFLLDNDIALLRLDTPIDFESCDTCEAVSLVTPENQDSVMPLGTEALSSGWGNIIGGENPTNHAEYPTELLWTTLYTTDCLAAPSLLGLEDVTITDNMFCAGTPAYDTDTCQGDSGGPLVVKDSDGVGTLLGGVVSWGIGCAIQGYPGVFTKVANYENWIKTTTNGECCSSGGSGTGSESTFVTDDDSGGGAIDLLFLLSLGLLLFFKPMLSQYSVAREQK